MRRVLLLLLFTAGCSQPADLFEVETGAAEVSDVILSVCGKTSPLHREGEVFVGRRVIDCEEGSGHIEVRTASGGHVRCGLGYVTYQPPFGGDGFSSRFKLQGEECLREFSIPIRKEGEIILSERAASECGLKQVRKHVRPSGAVELGYYLDEQSPAAAQCIWQWSEQQLNSSSRAPPQPSR